MINKIEFTTQYGAEYVALFDSRDLTEDEAVSLIYHDDLRVDKRIVIICNEQYETVFRSLINKEE